MLKIPRPWPRSDLASVEALSCRLSSAIRLAVGRRDAELSPDIGKPLVQSRVSQALDLAGVERSHDRCGRSFRRPSGRAMPCERRAGDQRGHRGGAFGWVERYGSSGRAIFPIAGSSNRASPRTATAFRKRTRTSRSQIDRRSGGRPSIKVRSADLRSSIARLLVQGQTTDLVQGAAVAEQHVQLA